MNLCPSFDLRDTENASDNADNSPEFLFAVLILRNGRYLARIQPKFFDAPFYLPDPKFKIVHSLWLDTFWTNYEQACLSKICNNKSFCSFIMISRDLKLLKILIE